MIRNPAIPITNPHRSQIPKATRNQDRLANPKANQVIHVTRPAVDRIRTADQDPEANRSQQVSLKANQTARQHRGPAAIRNRTPQANQVSPAHHQPANPTTASDPTLVLPAFRILIRKANQHLTREANPTPAAGRTPARPVSRHQRQVVIDQATVMIRVSGPPEAVANHHLKAKLRLRGRIDRAIAAKKAQIDRAKADPNRAKDPSVPATASVIASRHRKTAADQVNRATAHGFGPAVGS